MKEKLQEIINTHGQEDFIKAAEELLSTALQKKVPAGYERLIQPEQIAEVYHTIDDAFLDIRSASKALTDTYENKGSLLKEITQLETEIQIKEAEAIMMLPGENVDINGNMARVKTGAEQDMYRRYMSREERTKLAAKQGELQALDIEIYKARDLRDDAKNTAELIKSKAFVQANLLKFLS